KLLAELGAEVIKVESRANIDFLRRVTVEPDAVDRSWTFNDASRGQLSVALDLRTPRGRELGLALCAAADVVIENNRGDVVRKWGLDYEDVRRVRPDVVYVASQGFGRGAPPPSAATRPSTPARTASTRARARTVGWRSRWWATGPGSASPTRSAGRSSPRSPRSTAGSRPAPPSTVASPSGRARGAPRRR